MVILGGIGSIWGVIAGGVDPLVPRPRGPWRRSARRSRRAGLDFDPTKYQFGIYGLIIVVMMLIRPTGLIPERRHKIELEEGVHDTPFYDVQTEGTLTDRERERRLMEASVDNLLVATRSARSSAGSWRRTTSTSRSRGARSSR